jgi:hypothetical protein
MPSNNRQLALARNELNGIIAAGQLVYQTGGQILALRDAVRAWIDALGVEVSFAPETPPDVRDYLLGAALGAVEGAFAGALVGLLVGALCKAPGTGLAVGAGIGATLGAAGGASAVASGYRVRITAWRTLDGIAALVEAA